MDPLSLPAATGRTPDSPGTASSSLPGFGLDSADDAWMRHLRESQRPLGLGRIGDYELLSEVGRGGQGIVWRARQPGTQRHVAIKRLLAGSMASPAMRQRFEREIEAVCLLEHPSIVTVHGMEVVDDQPHLIMEWIEGVPVTAWAAGLPFTSAAAEVKGTPPAGKTIRQIIEMALAMCEAVQHAHQRGVIHRDLKPSNVLVDASGRPHVLDFGLAKLVGTSADPQTTQTAEFVGTLAYAAPEQIIHAPGSVDVRADVYALGLILCEMLTGQRPFGHCDPTDLPRAILHDDPPPPSRLRPDCEADLDTIVLKCLAKDPNQRYGSTGELAQDLRRLLADEPIAARPPSLGYLVRKFARRNRGAVLTAGAVAGVLVAATGVSLRYGLREAAARHGERAQRELVEAREKELEQVAQFQAEQLSSIDAQTMGVKLRADLLSKARAVAEQSKAPPQEIDARVAELEKLMAGSDFTGLALNTLDENIFQRALAAIEKQFVDQPLVKAQLLQTLADTLRELGLLDAASRPQEQALDIRRRVLGDEHVDTLFSINNMGDLLKAQGKLPEAERFCREALEVSRRVLGDEQRVTLAAINNMGHLLEAQGKWTEAEPYYREALEKQRRVLGEEHPDTLTSMNNLASVLQSQGKLIEAEPLNREALEKHRRVLGDEHPNTLRQINNMASLLKKQGKLIEAEPYQREVLEKRRRVLGEDHPNTLTAINNMGFLLQSQGKLGEAEGYYREALEKRRRVLGEDHSDTLASISALGSLLRSQGKLAEAEPYYREALEQRRRVLGEDHPETLLSISNMGSMLRSQGMLDEAESYYREALEKKRRLLGEDHPDTLLSINNMGSFLKTQGKLAQSEPYHLEALEKHRRVLGDDHPDTLLVIHNVGTLRRDQGQHVEARELFREALTGARKRYSGDHPRTAMYLHHLGEVVHRLGEDDEAQQLVQESLSMYRRHAEWGSAEYRHALEILRTICQDSGRNLEAADAVRENLDVQRRSLPPGSAELASALAATGSGLLGLKDYDAAEVVIRECLSIRHTLFPDDHPQAWLKYNAMSMLGEALVGAVEHEWAGPGNHEGSVARLREAEGLLLEACAKLKDDPAVPLPTAQRDYRREALERIVKLYDAWHAAAPDSGYDAKAAEWRGRLQELGAVGEPDEP